MTFFKLACYLPPKATTRGFAGQCRKNGSMCSRQISGLTTGSFSALRPRFQQEVALPANFMLRSISSSVPGFEAGVWLLQGGRRPSTVRSYDQKWVKFETFTTQVQDDAGAPRMSVLPASSQTVVAYLDYFSWLSSTFLHPQELNGLVTLYVEVALLLCMLLVRLSLSSWLGAYGSLSRQRSYTSTLRCDRPQKLSSSSAIFCHASCLWKEAPIVRQAQSTAEASPIDLSDAMAALLELDD